MAWKNMRQRCFNPKHPQFYLWGGRGIKICKRWSSFLNFKEDMGSSWKKGLSLDRKNNNGNYSKSNCRWVPHRTQMNNTRKNSRIRWKGKSLTIPEWERETGISRHAIRARLKKGYPLEVVFDLTLSPTGRKPYIKL